MQHLTPAPPAAGASVRGAAVGDWRILRLLSLYRLLLVTLLLVLFETGVARELFAQVLAEWFQWTCRLYALLALALMALVYRRRPPLLAQAQLHFLCDVAALTALIYSGGGVPGGLGVLLITPTVGCAMLVNPRLAALQASIATFAIFGEEFLRHSREPMTGSDFTASGVLGLILFGSSLAANVVAQRARASEALAHRVGSEFESLSRLNERIIQAMQTGVLVVDAHDAIRTFNRASLRLLGLSEQLGLLGAPLAQVSPPLHERLGAWRARVAGSTEPMVPRSGLGEVMPRFSYLSSAAQSPVLILIEDAALLRQQAQQMKLAALGRLSASIAHEIRNPLAAITHASQLLAETPDTAPENQRLLQMIRHHSGRIDKIVRDVLALSRRQPAVREAIELRSWLLRMAGLYQESQTQGARPIELTYIPDGLVVQFDPNHLQQILFNLWDNAFEHGRDTGRSVTVLLALGFDEAQHPWLEVRDDGPGVPPELQEQMFEPFFTTAPRGTGLGLYLVRELCEYNRARISYQPQPRGACFRLTFATEG